MKTQLAAYEFPFQNIRIRQETRLRQGVRFLAYHGNLQMAGSRVSGIRAPDGCVARGGRGLFRQTQSS